MLLHRDWLFWVGALFMFAAAQYALEIIDKKWTGHYTRNLLFVSLRWLGVSIIGAVGATILLKVITMIGFIHTSTGNGNAPYSIVHNAKDLITGIVYGIAGSDTIVALWASADDHP